MVKDRYPIPVKTSALVGFILEFTNKPQPNQVLVLRDWEPGVTIVTPLAPYQQPIATYDVKFDDKIFAIGLSRTVEDTRLSTAKAVGLVEQQTLKLLNEVFNAVMGGNNRIMSSGNIIHGDPDIITDMNPYNDLLDHWDWLNAD